MHGCIASCVCSEKQKTHSAILRVVEGAMRRRRQNNLAALNHRHALVDERNRWNVLLDAELQGLLQRYGLTRQTPVEHRVQLMNRDPQYREWAFSFFERATYNRHMADILLEP